MHGAPLNQDNPGSTTAKAVRNINFDEESTQDPPPTQEEIDAFNQDWYDQQLKTLKWVDLCGLLPYPAFGEDAQGYVSRTRHENSTHRHKNISDNS